MSDLQDLRDDGNRHPRAIGVRSRRRVVGARSPIDCQARRLIDPGGPLLADATDTADA